MYESGPSFAKPIRIAIAAVVLGFIGAVPPSDAPSEFDRIEEWLRWKFGTERIPHTIYVLAKEKRRAGYSSIMLLFPLDVEEKSREHISE